MGGDEAPVAGADIRADLDGAAILPSQQDLHDQKQLTVGIDTA